MKKVLILALALVSLLLFTTSAKAAPEGGNPWDRVWAAIDELRTQIAGIPAGPQGEPGPAGVNGTNGKTILNGTSNPNAAIGTPGDFYLNTATSQLFGPKIAGEWGSGVSLIGPQGPAGTGGSRLSTYRVTSPIVSIGIAETRLATATCNAGDQILSGGFAIGGSTVQITQSRPAVTTEAWQVEASTANPPAGILPGIGFVAAYAWCNDLTP
jgi:hypothetical protein